MIYVPPSTAVNTRRVHTEIKKQNSRTFPGLFFIFQGLNLRNNLHFFVAGNGETETSHTVDFHYGIDKYRDYRTN